MPNKNKSKFKTNRAAQIQLIIEEISQKLDYDTQYGMLNHACPDCGMLVFFTVSDNIHTSDARTVHLKCDDECGWKLTKEIEFKQPKLKL